MKKFCYHLLMIFVCVACLSTAHFAQSNVFTYQGNLNLSGQPANGNFDFEFALFDAVTAGNQLGVTQAINNVAVADGLFTVNINFNNNFTGDTRFLEIRVRQAGQPGYTTLNPRQIFNSTPYAIKSRRADEASVAQSADTAVSAFQATNATTATNALNLGGVAANQFVLTGDVRLTNARQPLPGSADYIQNTNTPQAAANFNINGTGQANIFRAMTQFEIGTERILSSPTFNSIFAGANSGAANTIGDNNSFFGARAGEANTSGGNNSFFGRGAGQSNETGFQNSFFGRGSGFATVTGNDNAFFGTFAGSENIGGSNNSAFGKDANVGSGELTFATAIGAGAIVSSSNTVALGRAVDTVRIPGSLNVSGAINGTVANAATATNALSLGGVAANQYVLTGDGRLSDERNPLPGSPNYIQNRNGVAQASTNFHISGNGTVGGTLRGDIVSATTGFNMGGARVLFGDGGSTFAGIGSGTSITTGNGNSFFGRLAGSGNTEGSSNSFFGRSAGSISATGSHNTFLGADADFGSFAASGERNTLLGSSATLVSGINNATAIGSRAAVSQSNSLVLGSINSVNGATADTNVGIGTTAPTERLDIFTNNAQFLVGGAGCASGSIAIGLNGPLGNCTNYSVRGDGQSVFINRPTGGLVVFRENNGSSQVLIHPGGSLEVRVLGTSGGTALCRNASNIIAFCSSSLRYKKNIVSFAPGMSFIRQLQPIAYEWKADGMKDVGFGAEDIAKIDPRFVTYNDNGEVEGIKYDRLSTAFVNAFREQETEISSQRTEIESLKNQVVQQKSEIAELKVLICSVAPNAATCAVPK